ncbi:MAG: hypothetical protein KBB52_06775 [Candidatus Omnitrophica bacterium]|nr:hypothetical protein [Candidatus Omnitrophota bacterium]
MTKNGKSSILLNTLLVIALVVFAASFAGAFPYLKGTLIPEHTPKGPVKVVQAQDGWKLTVGGKPYFVKGVCYQYVPIGEAEQYDIFSDPRKPWIADGKMMKSMGVNTVRFYKPGKDVRATKRVIQDLHNKYGIKTALGHYLGFWDWPPPNYADPAFRANIMAEVMEMVRAYKDEEGLLFWIIGNENNYSFDRGIRDWSTPEIDALGAPLKVREAKARIYYRFMNDLAKAIKEIDSDHPVVMGNGELVSIYIAKEECPDVDILGGIVYQGKSFGTYFDRLKRNFGKPNVFIEFGSDSFDAVWQQESQDWQAFFIKLQWNEIVQNRAGGDGAGNSLGGFVFEWSDEWWKHNPDYNPGRNIHDVEASWSNTAYYFDAKAGNNINEEWWGITSLDSKNLKNGLERRTPKKAFNVLRALWKGDEAGSGRKYMTSALIALVFIVIIFLIRKKI